MRMADKANTNPYEAPRSDALPLATQSMPRSVVVAVAGASIAALALAALGVALINQVGLPTFQMDDPFLHGVIVISIFTVACELLFLYGMINRIRAICAIASQINIVIALWMTIYLAAQGDIVAQQLLALGGYSTTMATFLNGDSYTILAGTWFAALCSAFRSFKLHCAGFCPACGSVRAIFIDFLYRKVKCRKCKKVSQVTELDEAMLPRDERYER